MRIIGDVHGKWAMYKNLIRNCEESVQIGDMGVGFFGHKDMRPADPAHVFFPGNHDNPETCESHPNCLGYWGEHKGMFFFGGASSIDAHLRTEGRDWWPREQMPMADMYEAQAFYEDMKTDIVLSHDAPFSICGMIQEASPESRGWGPVRETRTTVCLDELFRFHKPKIWICGHWHSDIIFPPVEGTTFIILGELSYLDINLKSNKYGRINVPFTEE